MNDTPKKSRSLANLIAQPGVAPVGAQIEAPREFFERKATYLEPSDSPDWRRVSSLPRRKRLVEDPEVAQALIDWVKEQAFKEVAHCTCAKIRPSAPDCLINLKDIQAWALYEAVTVGGLLGSISVGNGKTLIGILLPVLVPCKTAVILCPPSVVEQLFLEYELIKNHWRVPSLISHATKPYSHVIPGAPVLHVVPYSTLQQAKNNTLLKDLNPDIVIADECHKIGKVDTQGNPESATTTRFVKTFYDKDQNGKRYRNRVKFFGYTGTLTEDNLDDYRILAELALGDRAPVPFDASTSASWSSALTVPPGPPGVLLQLCNPGESVARAFHRRLAETPGIITTTIASTAAPLVITEKQAPDLPPQIAEMLATLRATWTRPDGEEFYDALSVSRCARELACGMYYRWIFPRREDPDLIAKWRLARAAWHKELRIQLTNRNDHLDSALLLTQAAARYHGNLDNPDRKPVWNSQHWPEWYEVKDLVQPETQAVRVHPYLVHDAAEWAHKNRGIVWYLIDDFGSWLAKEGKLPKHGGGADAAAKLRAENGDRSIIASIKSHGTGRNGLQYLFQKQLVAQPPSKNKEWEQLLGRLHRHGQTDQVSTEFYRHTPELRSFVDSALRRAVYVRSTMGQDQKLLIGYKDSIEE